MQRMKRRWQHWVAGPAPRAPVETVFEARDHGRPREGLKKLGLRERLFMRLILEPSVCEGLLNALSSSGSQFAAASQASSAKENCLGVRVSISANVGLDDAGYPRRAVQWLIIDSAVFLSTAGRRSSPAVAPAGWPAGSPCTGALSAANAGPPPKPAATCSSMGESASNS